MTYGLEEIANSPAKSKVASISTVSEGLSDEEVTIIRDTSDIDSDENTASLINEDAETNIDDDDEDEDDGDDTTVIVR